MLIERNNVDIAKIKLVIWDLDNTFWNGTFTEGGYVPLERNIALVKALTQRGIMNSICSKNNYEDCEKELKKLGVWEYFVFPSINWNEKGQRVISIIQDMNLRPVNTLFLDDEPTNLERVLTVEPNVMCSSAEVVVPELEIQLEWLKKDDSYKRLQQYRSLQKKVEAQKEYRSNDVFLKDSQIRIQICEDCQQEAERIFELINRTNQLNYTKIRATQEEVDALLSNKEYKCAYIRCRDKFSDYGIVGFLAIDIHSNTLVHFLFSCRTIGMGVEQYVYAKVGFPKLNVIGDVVTHVQAEGCPSWILDWNSENDTKKQIRKAINSNIKIAVHGPCDVSQIIPFFSDESVFDEKFAYISEQKTGMFIESFNHTSQILAAERLTADEKAELVNTIPFIDEAYFKNAAIDPDCDFYIFSMLTDYSLGMYVNNENPNLRVVFGQYTTDYTNAKNWDNIQRILMEGKSPSEEIQKQYEYFRTHYHFVGRISDEEMICNLQSICDKLPMRSKLILLNGAEQKYPGVCKPSHLERDLLHKKLNALLNDFASKNAGKCYIVDVNQYLTASNPYLDTINHYKKEVYFHMAKDIEGYILKTSGQKLKTKKQTELVKIAVKKWISLCKAKVVQIRNRVLKK